MGVHVQGTLVVPGLPAPCGALLKLTPGPCSPAPLCLQASVSRLVLHDLSPAALQPHHLPPAVRGQPLPRVARQLAVDRLSLSHSVAAAAAPRSTTHVELHDLLVDGFAGEAGSFLARCVRGSLLLLLRVALLQACLLAAALGAATLRRMLPFSASRFAQLVTLLHPLLPRVQAA